MGLILTHFIFSGRTTYQGTTGDLFYMVLAANWQLQYILIMTQLEELIHFNLENVIEEQGSLSINSEMFFEEPRPLMLCYVQNPWGKGFLFGPFSLAQVSNDRLFNSD